MPTSENPHYRTKDDEANYSRMHSMALVITKEAAQYGLSVVDIEPQALEVLVIQMQQARLFGNRVAEFLIHQALKQDFITLMGQGQQRVVIRGMPIRAQPETQPDYV